MKYLVILILFLSGCGLSALFYSKEINTEDCVGHHLKIVSKRGPLSLDIYDNIVDFCKETYNNRR